MNETLVAFLLTTLAGISTLTGYFAIYFDVKNSNRIIASSLSFASGVMICTSIGDLIPESVKLLETDLSSFGTISLCFFGIMLGIILSMIVDYYVPNIQGLGDTNLFRVGLLSMLAIAMHNIPEGIATFIAGSSNIHLGISLAIAIAMHNIPEGITISIPIYYSTGKKSLAFLYTLISALSEPLGALLALLFLQKVMNNMILGIILSLIAGIMLEISFKTLLPNTKKYKEKVLVYISFIVGCLFMLLSIFI